MRAPEKPAVGFAGELVDLGFDWSRATMVAHVALPLDAFDGFTKGVGVPPTPDDRDDPAKVRMVALLSCRRPVHPQREGDVIAVAAIELLIRLIEDGAMLSPVNMAAFSHALMLHRGGWEKSVPPDRGEVR